MRIIVVEDEPDLADLLERRLKRSGYVVDVATTLAEAREAVRLISYAVMLLDRRLPDGDGLDLVTEMRRRKDPTPVIVLSALDQVPDRVSGLDAGADDYLIKPFDADELNARIRAAVRRPGGEPPPPLVCGRLTFDQAHLEASVEGVPLKLKRRELAVLGALMLRAGRVVRRDHLVEQVFGYDDDISSNTLEAHVSRLRSRLATAKAGVVIHPVRGVGYVIDEAA